MRPHEKLEVYWIAQEFAAFCAHVRPRIQNFSPADAHDLDKSSGSIPNNICEAANESSPGDIARFFRYAKRENGEASGIFTRQKGTGITEVEWRIARHYTDRIGAALTKLIEYWERRSKED